MLDLFTDTEADLGRELGEARIFIFNLTAGSVSAAYGTVIVLAIAFGIAAIGALLYYGLQSMSSAGYGYGADTYSYSRSQTTGCFRVISKRETEKLTLHWGLWGLKTFFLTVQTGSKFPVDKRNKKDVHFSKFQQLQKSAKLKILHFQR